LPNLEWFRRAVFVTSLAMVGLPTAGRADAPAPLQTAAEQRVITDTAAAIDACYHWGGEEGDQSAERNKEIDAGIERDCPLAEKLARQAYKQYPKNSALASKILELIDVDYFPVSLPEKRQICETATAQFKQQFLESNRRDVLFSYECADEALKVYDK